MINWQPALTKGFEAYLLSIKFVQLKHYNKVMKLYIFVVPELNLIP